MLAAAQRLMLLKMRKQLRQPRLWLLRCHAAFAAEGAVA
jgi:hypothetical protein